MTTPQPDIRLTAALLEEARKRRTSDFLLKFEPHRKQQEFIDAVISQSFRICCYLGANRSGKSDAGAYVGAYLARFGKDDARFVGGKGSSVQVRDRATAGWVSALDYPLSRDVLQPKYFDNGFLDPGQQPFIPSHEIKEWRLGDQTLKLKNGSLIVFKSAEAGRAKYQGKGLDWFHMDEEHPFEIFQEVAIRVGGGRSLQIFITATLLPPEGKTAGPSWLFPEIIKPVQAGSRPDIHITTASIYDNPHILPREIEALERIYAEGSKIRQIRLNGALIPGIGGSLAYPAFNHAIHVSDLEVDAHRPLCWSLDFNVEPFGTVVGQRSPDGGFHVVRELVLERGDLKEMAEYFRRFAISHRAPIYIYGDETARNGSIHYKGSSYDFIMQELAGMQLHLRVPEKNPSIPLRLNTVNRALSSPAGTSMVKIDRSCAELIADLEQVQLAPDGKILKITDRRNPYFRRTATSDALGYWICMEDPSLVLAGGYRRHGGRQIRQVRY